MKILVLDNYDSFTYNLVHLLKELGNFKNLDVYRNDKISLEGVAKYDKILISPGPGLPSESGIMMDLIKRYASLKSILGICLGHQGICEVFGAKLFNMKEVVHGQSTLTKITDKEEPLFKNVPSELMTGRYHSWNVVENSIPKDFRITAKSEDGVVMGVSHKKFSLKGLQFHPESILTEHGRTIMANWLNLPD